MIDLTHLTHLTHLTLAERADYNAALAMGHDTQPVLDRAYMRSHTRPVAEPFDHATHLARCLPLLAKASRTVADLAAQIAAEQAERDTQHGMVRDIHTRQIARLMERHDTAMGDVQRFSRAVAESRNALEMKQAAE